MDLWFFENSGFAKVKELNDSYKGKAISFANAQLSKNYADYSPWMSNVENLETLEVLFNEQDFILTNPISMGVLENLYLDEEIESKLTFGNIYDTEMDTLRKSIALVSGSSGDISRLFSEVVQYIVPINTDAGKFQAIGNGFSSHLARGSVFLSVPKMENDNELQLAINIAHEVGHQCLYIYQTADPIIAEGLHKPVYSFVRKTERPVIQSFHATVALAFMVRFLSELKDSEIIRTKYFSEAREKLSLDFIQSLDSFSEVKFTDIGQLLFEELRSYAKTI